MTIFMAVSVGIVVAAVMVLTVFLVQAIVQFKKTVRSAELLINKANMEMDKVQNITNAVSAFTGVVSSSVGKTAFTFAHLMIRLMNRQRWRRRTEQNHTDPRETAYRQSKEDIHG
jgi:hypothetical protein